MSEILVYRANPVPPDKFFTTPGQSLERDVSSEELYDVDKNLTKKYDIITADYHGKMYDRVSSGAGTETGNTDKQ